MQQYSLDVQTNGRATIEITARVGQLLRESGVQRGLCHVFVHHTSASLIITENADADVRHDLETWLARRR